MKRYIRLSHFIDMETPLYGGERSVIIKPVKSISKGDSSNTSFLSFSNHTGTHIDFPKHFSKDGKSINDYPPGFWIFNNPFLLNYQAKKNEIIELNMELDEIPHATDFLIIKTGFQKYRCHEKYWKFNPGLHPGLAGRLRKRCQQIKVIGFDLISVSSYQNRQVGRRAHKEFLINNDILLIEDMDLNKTDCNIEKIICLPLMINSIDASPVTILAETYA